MTDHRPANCRFRLQDEHKSYPRSSCSACGKTIMTGLGRECSVERDRLDAIEKVATVATALLAELFEASDWGWGTEQVTREEADAWGPLCDKVKAFLDAQKPKQEEKTE